MANVGKNIRILRKQNNMTQDDLAEQLYVSRQTVSNYETGKTNPDIDMLVKIAEVLGSDVNILIFGIPVSVSRRKEWIRLVCAALLLLMLVTSCHLLTPLAEQWTRDWFDLGPTFVIRILLEPMCYLVCGWVTMQAVSVLWGIRRQNRKGIVMLYALAAILLRLYLILMVPVCIEFLYVSGQKYFSGMAFEEIRQFLPDLWRNKAVWTWYKLSKVPFLFLFMGLALWNGRGERPEPPAGCKAGDSGS